MYKLSISLVGEVNVHWLYDRALKDEKYDEGIDTPILKVRRYISNAVFSKEGEIKENI